MIAEISAGVLIEVRAYPGAKRNEVRGIHGGALKVAVTQQPEKGKANKAIREELAKSLHLKMSQIDLINGETTSIKKFLLRNVKIKDIKEQIEALSKNITAK
ncbi:MAG: DUF167 domain-containing protein [Planctomycetaceae bacterium]|jgi:uncharacterized protein (TIGR00251 family)|nr:DUF167 domain-containing protein [Planctomycetaceae bacterium]